MTILDVGCGTGISTEILISKGYNVECLSPDLYNQKVINEKFKGAVKFHLTKFEEFSTEKKHDIILMSESSQYITLKKLFEKCKGLLNKDGYLLISDYFRKEATGYYRNCAVLSRFLEAQESINTLPQMDTEKTQKDSVKFCEILWLRSFLDEAEKNGFKILKSEDITENVLPTLLIGEQYYKKFVVPITEALISLANDEIPMITNIAKFFFRRKIKKIAEDIHIKNPEKLNPEKFRQNIRYMIYLFQKV